MSDGAQVGMVTSAPMVQARRTVATAEDAIDLLADRAIAAGLATDEYRRAVIAREREYPTGLPTSIPIAIPHIHDGCLRSFLACVTLTDPVAFGSMDGDDEPLQVPIVFAFGITDPSLQTKVLRQLAVLFQNAETLAAIAAATTDAELLDVLAASLGDGLVVLTPEQPHPTKE